MKRVLALLGLTAFLTGAWRFRSRLCLWLGCERETIVIHVPSLGTPVSSPLQITGRGRTTQHNQLSVEVRDAANVVLGSGVANVNAPLGQAGAFSCSLAFAAAPTGTPGFVLVFDTSPVSGVTTHLASVLVTFA